MVSRATTAPEANRPTADTSETAYDDDDVRTLLDQLDNARRDAGVTQRPTFDINGRRVLGAQPYEDNPAWHSKAVFVLDPDGLRIELLQAPGDPDALPGKPQQVEGEVTA